MALGWFLLPVAFAATLTSHAHADSKVVLDKKNDAKASVSALAETAAKVKKASSGTPSTTLNEVKSEIKQVESKWKKGMATIIRDAGVKSAAAKKRVGIETTASSVGIEKNTEKVGEYREAVEEQVAELSGVSQKGTEELIKENIDFEELSQEVVELMKERTGELSETWSEVSDDNVEEFSHNLGDTRDDTRQEEEDSMNEVKENWDESGEAFTELGDEVGDTQAETVDNFGDIMEFGYEVKDVKKENDQYIVGLGRDTSKSSKAIQKDATSYKPTIEGMAAKADTTAIKAVQKVGKNGGKELKTIAKDENDEIKALTEENEEKAEGMDGEVTDAISDLKAQLGEGRSEDADTARAGKTAFRDSQSAFLEAKGEASDLRKAAGEVTESGMAMLNRLKNKMDEEEVTADGDSENAVTKMEQEIDGETTNLRDFIARDLHESTAAVAETVDKEIGTLQAKVNVGSNMIAGAIQNVHSQAGNVGSVIGATNAELLGFQDYLGSVSEGMQVATSWTTRSMEDAENKGLAALGNTQVAIDQEIKSATVKVDTEADNAGKTTSNLAGTVYRDVKGKIDGLDVESETLLERSKRAIASAAQRGEQVMGGMQDTIRTLAGLKDGINQGLPEAKKEIRGALTLLDEEIDKSKGNLKATKEKAMARVHEVEQEMRGSTEKLVQETRFKLNGALGEESSQTESLIEGLESTVVDLKKSSDSDYDRGMNFQATVRQLVEGALKEIAQGSDASDTNAADLSERLRFALDQAKAAIKSQGPDSAVLEKIAIASFQQSRQTSQDWADKQTAAAREAARTKLAGLSKAALKQLEASSTRIDGFIEQNRQSLGELKNSNNEVRDAAQAEFIKASGRNTNALNKIASLEAYQASLEEKTKKAEEEAKGLLDTQKATLSKASEASAGVMLNTGYHSLRELEAMAEKGWFSDAKTREDMLKEKEMAAVAEVQAKLAQQTAAIAAAVQGTKDTLGGYDRAEGEMVSELQREAGGVKMKILTGEDKINRLKQGEEASMGNSIEGDLRAMDTLENAFQGAKQKAGYELEALDSEFSGKLSSMKGRGEAAAEQMVNEIDALMENAPDFEHMFVEDTRDGRDSLAELTDKINHAKGWTGKVMTDFGKKLGDVKDQREFEAANIHTRGSSLKRMVVDETDRYVDELDKTYKSTQKMQEDMNNDISSFKANLTSLGKVEVGHDQRVVEDMEHNTFELTAGHTRLMDWKGRFVTKTQAWRDEVENSLRKLGRGLGQDDSEMSETRLAQEMQVNEGLRSMQLRIEDQVAASDSKQTNQFTNIADKMSKGFSDIASANEANQKTSGLAEQEAEEALRRKEQMQQYGISKVRAGELKLEESANILQQESGVAANQMGNMFQLPKASASPYNSETHTRYTQVMNEIDHMQTSSLLQTSANLRSDTASMDDEIAAVEALNSELSSENTKLAKQNTKLEGGLEYMAKK